MAFAIGAGHMIVNILLAANQQQVVELLLLKKTHTVM